MNTTELLSASQASERPSFGDEITELLPWVAAIVVIGPITLLSLMLWAPFLLLLAPVVAVAAAVSVVAVAGAVLAVPFMLLRHRIRRALERRRSVEHPIAIPGAIAQVGGPQ
jgi:hypothetical protein